MESYGLALNQAVCDVDTLRNRADVSTLGTRVQVVRTRDGERSYYLDGFVVYSGPSGRERRRLYRLAGGVGSAVTVFDETGTPIADANRPGRGLSAEFRAWIADAVETDRTLCGF